jgi:hypothetical protein
MSYDKSRFQTMQTIAWEWAVRCFGKEHCFNSKVRALRLMEEAIEYAQAVECNHDDMRKVMEMVLERPPGLPHKEIGGIMMTMAVACRNSAIDPMLAFEIELLRVLAIDPLVFAQRNKEKVQPSA